MAMIRVMRRKDAPHVVLPASAAMRKRTDVLEEAWLNTETKETTLELPKTTEKAKPKPQGKRAAARKALGVDDDLLSQAQAALED